jgi:hypothetical protein
MDLAALKGDDPTPTARKKPFPASAINCKNVYGGMCLADPMAARPCRWRSFIPSGNFRSEAPEDKLAKKASGGVGSQRESSHGGTSG